MTLIETARSTLRRNQESPRTEEAYAHWIRELPRFHPGEHPRPMSPDDATAVLNDFAVRRRTSASTQNQALCPIVFLYERILNQGLPAMLTSQGRPAPHGCFCARSPLSEKRNGGILLW